MSFKHLLVHVDSTPDAEGRLALAATLARRHGARLTGLFAESDSLGSSIVGRRSVEQHREAALAARSRFNGQANAAGVDAEWWSLGYLGQGDLVGAVTACCRYVDLALFGQHAPERSRIPQEVSEHVVADCGRPVMIVPADGHFADVGRRVVVGWNASRGAARAVNDALPLLKEAEFVGILSFQAEAQGAVPGEMPPASILDHLVLHGVTPSYDRAVEGLSVADALLNYAFDSTADRVLVGVHPQEVFRQSGFTMRELLAVMRPALLLAQ
jgi:nucleotide-binding universal stress UspA family protein